MLYAYVEKKDLIKKWLEMDHFGISSNETCIVH